MSIIRLAVIAAVALIVGAVGAYQAKVNFGLGGAGFEGTKPLEVSRNAPEKPRSFVERLEIKAKRKIASLGEKIWGKGEVAPTLSSTSVATTRSAASEVTYEVGPVWLFKKITGLNCLGSSETCDVPQGKESRPLPCPVWIIQKVVSLAEDDKATRLAKK